MKNKININRPFVNREDITERKNFQKVLLDYKKASTPIYKTPRFLGVMSLAAVVVSVAVYFAFFSVHESSNLNTVHQNTIITAPAIEVNQNTIPAAPAIKTVKPFINPPLANLEKKYTTFKIDATAGGEIKYETGSIVKFPAGCFVDSKGNRVKGKIDIKYREFHDAVDFFLSGIPMTYDSGGIRFTFESAGMMDVQGSQHDEPVFVSADKNIAVQMASKYPGNKYNLYFLDTVNRKWDFRGKDAQMQLNSGSDTMPSVISGISNRLQVNEIVTSDESSIATDDLKKLKKEIAVLEKSKPIEPKKATHERSHFTIEFDPREFPEIIGYKEVVFEIGAENKNFNPLAYKPTYTDLKLVEYKTGVSYKLKLGLNDSVITYIVYPVYDEKDYSTAKKEYEKKFKEYEARLAQRKEEEIKKQEEWAAQLKKQEEDRNNYIAVAQKTDLVYRTFTINGFGVYNCDNPLGKPKGVSVMAKFNDESGTDLNLNTVYLADKGVNALYSFYRESGFYLKFNPAQKNILWALTPANKLAVFRVEDFQNLNMKSNIINFRMKVSDAEFKNESEVRAFLNI